jgi:1-phosphofructokinase
VPVIADLVGDHLRAALASGVAFVKIAHNELVETGWAADDRVSTLVRTAHQIREGGADSVVISRAELPSLALLGEEMSWVELPALQIADSRGAGDSMTAGVAAHLAQGGDLVGAVRSGAAAGALNVTRHGLGTGQADAVKELARRVRLTPVIQEEGE